MKHHRVWIGIALLLSAATLGLVGCGNTATNPPADQAKKEPPKKEPEAPPDAGLKKAPPDMTEKKLKDLKWDLPKGWEAEYKEGLVEWRVSKEAPPDYPVIYIATILSTREPKDLEEFVQKVQKEPDRFGSGHYWETVTEKGPLPDGYYLVGKVKKADEKAKGTGFSIVRDLGGAKRIFQCFKADDPAQRKESMEVCKKAKF